MRFSKFFPSLFREKCHDRECVTQYLFRLDSLLEWEFELGRKKKGLYRIGNRPAAVGCVARAEIDTLLSKSWEKEEGENWFIFVVFICEAWTSHTVSVSFLFLACFPFYQDSNIRRRNCCCNRPTVIWVVSPSFLLKKQNKGYVMQSILARRRAACIVVTRDCVRVWFGAEGGNFYTLSSSCRPQQPIAATCSLPCQQQNIRKGSKGWV